MGQLPKKFCHPDPWVSPLWLTVSLFLRNVSVMEGHGCIIIIQLHLNKCTWLYKECYRPAYPAVPHRHVVRLKDYKVLWVPWKKGTIWMQQIPICSYSIWSHTTAVMMYRISPRVLYMCQIICKHQGRYGPIPRPLQRKELPRQPPKHTFCKALSRLFCSSACKFGDRNAAGS